MSPKSRGRMPRNQDRARRTTQRSPGAQLLHELERELRDADPLSAELAVSALVGAERQARAQGPAGLVADVARRAARAHRPTSLGVLRCLAVLADDAERELAAEGVRRLTEVGVTEPAWAAVLDDVAATEAWVLRDVYGDGATIGVEFARPARPHTMVVLVDHAAGGSVAGMFIDDDPEGARALRDEQAQDPLVTVEGLDLATARSRLEAALAATDAVEPDDLDEDVVSCSALLRARLRALPEPAPTPPAPAAPAQAVLVEQFLRSPEAGQLTGGAAVERCARLVVAARAAAEPADPLHIGPAALADLWLDQLLDADLTDDEDEVLADVVLAWTRFAATRAGLPQAARDHLVDVAGELAEAYRAGPLGPRGENLVASYAGDLLEAGVGPTELQEAITRRVFAVPLSGSGAGEEDAPPLDPADPDERRLLIIGEHPEYAAALDDPLAPDEVDGVNPRLHIAMHEVVANQLWDDDPPEAWRAAQRLLDTGMERHEVLHELAAAVTGQLWHALSDRTPVDPDDYRAALDALAAPAPAGGRGRRPPRLR